MIIIDREAAVASLINQEIVALFQGLGEIGPRGLGQ